ncbi:MAG: hypothetical protein ACKOA5_02900 [Actinomycetota bacterium]
MSISEAARYEMQKELRNRLGEPVADTLMEHLPPSGWSDVTRTSDVGLVAADVTNVRQELDRLRDEMNKRIDSLVHGMWAAVGIFSGAFIALFFLIAAKV